MTPRLPHPRLLNHPILLRLSRPSPPFSFRAHPFPRQPSTRTLSTLPPPPKTHSTASKLGLVLGITSLLYLTNDSNELLTEFPIAWYEFSANVLSSLASKVVVFCEDEKSSENGIYGKWKEHKIGLYENRIRNFSHPIKVFNYFASVQKHGHHYMTPEDFIRSIIPYRFYHHTGKTRTVDSAVNFFKLADMDGDGLISFPEYIFFVTLLGTPAHHWDISFKLFDTDNSGYISADEFKKMIEHHEGEVGLYNRMGLAERKSKARVDQCTGLLHYFFGPRGDKGLGFNEFRKFMEELQLQVLKLEFYQFDVDDKETISMKDFAKAVISYAKTTDLDEYVKRIDALPGYEERVSFEQFRQFDQVIKSQLEDLTLAYHFYTSVRDGFSRPEFQRVAKVTTGLGLTTDQVDVLFRVFDANNDGLLAGDEFISVMKGRSLRGLDQPRDAGISRYFGRVWECITK